MRVLSQLSGWRICCGRGGPETAPLPRTCGRRTPAIVDDWGRIRRPAAAGQYRRDSPGDCGAPIADSLALPPAASLCAHLRNIAARNRKIRDTINIKQEKVRRKKMPYALKNYSRILTRLWNNFVWNIFLGFFFFWNRYTIIHVGIWKSWFPPLRYPGIIFGNLKHLEITYTSYMWPGLAKSHS